MILCVIRSLACSARTRSAHITMTPRTCSIRHLSTYAILLPLIEPDYPVPLGSEDTATQHPPTAILTRPKNPDTTHLKPQHRTAPTSRPNSNPARPQHKTHISQANSRSTPIPTSHIPNPYQHVPNPSPPVRSLSPRPVPGRPGPAHSLVEFIERLCQHAVGARLTIDSPVGAVCRAPPPACGRRSSYHRLTRWWSLSSASASMR